MMSNQTQELRLPRPVEPLPTFAHAKARSTLAGKLEAAFAMSAEAATAIADAVVDPTTVRKKMGEPTDPQVEEIRVPGGTLLGIRTEVWSRLVMPDPRNPRIGPSRRHPFAVDPGTGGEDCRFRPIPDPRTLDGASPETPELCVNIESRDHLAWASGQASTFVLAKNNWKDSIASQGVMEAVWIAPTTYVHDSDESSVTALSTVEGSSRMTAVHELLSVRSADVPYNDELTKLRAYYRKVNEAFDRGVEPDEAIALRCERVPALLIVGFRQHADGKTTFPTAVKSFVALRHVDPPTPWGEGPESESLADEVLDEMYRRGLISETEHLYFAGNCTKAEAVAAHLSEDPAQRAARIVALFKKDDERIETAIRVAVSGQSTRKRITSLLRNQLATALILRSVDGKTMSADKIRPYMRRAFGESVHSQPWESTGKPLAALTDDAMIEVRRAIGDSTVTEPGPASLELAVRGAYPLLVSGRLSRGTDNVDRRNPGEVLDAMRRTVQGIYQLYQVLSDFAQGNSMRAVNEDGTVLMTADGSAERVISEGYLREEFPPPGRVRSRPAGDTPAEIFKARLADFSESIETLESTFAALNGVMGEDGLPLVESSGTDPRACNEWRRTLSDINDELNIWSRTFRRVFGTVPEPQSGVVADEEDACDYSGFNEEESGGGVPSGSEDDSVLL